MNVNVSSTPSGGAVVRAADGTALAGDGSGPATLSYTATGPNGQLSITNGTGVTQPLGAKLSSGELRNVDLPQLQSQLSELTSGVVTQLNNISNNYSSVPPPTTMIGQNTGLDSVSAISGFTGTTTIAQVNTSTNAVAHQITFNFSNDTFVADGSPTGYFAPSDFVAALNSVLGKGFTAYFGMNNLVNSSTFTNYNTGLTSTSASGFPAGQTLQLQLSGSSGALIQDVTVTTPAGTTMASMLGALNASPGGVGAYGAFSLNSNGQLSFAANNNSGVTVAVLADNTANTATGASNAFASAACISRRPLPEPQFRSLRATRASQAFLLRLPWRRERTALLFR